MSRRADEPRDWLPPSLLADAGLPSLREALLYVHRPPADAPVDLLLERRHPAQRRLAFEELLAHQLSLKLLRRRIQSDPGWPLTADGALKGGSARGAAVSSSPARNAGRSAEIEADLALAQPMLRLVQGDVGCGKTLVAALAATRALAAGRQVALMAPTELLADQHAQNFAALVRAARRHRRAADRPPDRQGAARRALAGIRAAGTRRIVIGTHALFQEGVRIRRRWRSSSSTSSTASACISAWRCARRARCEAQRPAPADHDRDADSAHPRDDRLRRSRRLGDRRAAARAHAR